MTYNLKLCRRLPGVMLSVSRHGFTLMALLDSVRDSKRQPVISDGISQLSYNDLYDKSRVMASHIKALCPQDKYIRIALIGSNSTGFVTSVFAVSAMGAEVYLPDPAQKHSYYDDFFKSQQIDFIIGNSESIEKLSVFGIPCLNYDSAISTTPFKLSSKKQGTINILTSGSTATPKVEKRSITLFRHLSPLTDIINKTGLSENQSVLISVPLYHGYGFAALLLSLFLKQDIMLMKKFETLQTIGLFKNKQIQNWIVVPQMITKVYEAGGLDMTTGIKIISGGDVLPARTVKIIHSETSCQIYNLYGTSETGVCTIASNDELKIYPGTLGKAIRGLNTKIIHNDASETGELFIKCSWSSDERNDSYIPTGDLVSKNKKGYYFFKARKDDLMVINGKNIYPAELENIIRNISGVAWVKARSITDQNGHAKIHLDLLVTEPQSFDTTAFLNELSDKIPGYMIPKSLALLSEVPETKLM